MEMEKLKPGKMQVIEPTETNPAAVIQNAIAQGADLDKLEKLLELQERWEANEAKKAYHEDMAKFKANPPKIIKDKLVSYKATQYSHASLANITSIINAELSKYGLSASWKTEQDDNISVTCVITHRLGHSEQTTLKASADNSGSKNSIQAMGSTLTYLERYSLLALTGLAAHDMDDDGETSEGEPEYINTDMVTEINDLIKETKSDKAKFLKWVGADSVEKIHLNWYSNVISALKDKKNGKKAK